LHWLSGVFFTARLKEDVWLELRKVGITPQLDRNERNKTHFKVLKIQVVIIIKFLYVQPADFLNAKR
jgi:hypothetical protein